MRSAIVAVLAALMLLPMSSQAADGNHNYVGVGLGLASAGGYTDTGYAFLFQMQRDPHSAIGFAYHQGEIITATYKGYVGPYANSLFWEGGMLVATSYDIFLPMLGVGVDVPFGNKSMMSFTAGTAFGDVDTAFVARAAFMFEM